MVEFALVLPLFLLMIFGTIEFSLLLYNKAMLTNAAREGARVGVVYRPSTSQRTSLETIKRAVSNYCSGNMISLGSSSGLQDPIVVILSEKASEDDPEAIVTSEENYDPSKLLSGEFVKVTANYDYSFLILPNIFKLINATGITDLPPTLTLVAVSQMRAE